MQIRFLFISALLCLSLAGCSAPPVQSVLQPTSDPVASSSQTAAPSSSAPSVPMSSATASQPEPASSSADAASASASPEASREETDEISMSPVRTWGSSKASLEEQLATFAEQAETLAQKADEATPSGDDPDEDWDDYYSLHLELGRVEDQLYRLDEQWSKAYRAGEITEEEHLAIQDALNQMEQRLTHAQSDLELRFNAFR